MAARRAAMLTVTREEAPARDWLRSGVVRWRRGARWSARYEFSVHGGEDEVGGVREK